MRLVVSVVGCLLAVSVGGCLAGAPLRTAAVAQPGEATLVISFTVFTVGPGDVTSSDGRRRKGNTGGGVDAVTNLFTAMLSSVEVSLLYGVDGGCEVGGGLSFLRLYGEGRCAIAEGDAGAAVALAVGVPFTAFAGGAGVVFGRAGIDVSAGGDGFTAAGGVYLTFENELHTLMVEEEGDPTGPISGVVGPPGHSELIRPELRLVVVAGLGVADVTSGAALFGGHGYYTLWHAGYRRARCTFCGQGVTITGFDEGWGVGMLTGFSLIGHERSP